MKDLFVIRGELSKKQNSTLIISGIALLIFIWALVTSIFPTPIFPTPLKVLKSFKELHFEDGLVLNLIYSIKLNVLGYLEAILVALPIGFVIGLFPIFKGLFNKQIDALRFVPLSAVTGLFIVWFGIEDSMKIHFLAFGIVVYLLPVVAQRVNEVEKVYEQTVITLGASKWQMIKTVFIPSTLAKVFVDIRVMVAISWTYIIIAEVINKTAGIGALAYTSARQSRIDKVFAILLVIILVGFIQDKLFEKLDKLIFKFKYV